MQRRPRSRKTPANLSNSVCQHLNMYALAASAAGVGVLALAQPAEAKIVFTSTWVEILPGSGPVYLDLNNDGIADFQFSRHAYSTSFKRYSTLRVMPQNQSNAIWGTGSAASALGSGVSVGSQGKFQPGHTSMAKAGIRRFFSTWGYVTRGQWAESTRRYLGLKFTIQGETHYGWARLNVTATNHGVYAALTGYAYETMANTPIVTGKQQGSTKKKRSGVNQTTPSLNSPTPPRASLGLLAGGALGLNIWRKRDATPK